MASSNDNTLNVADGKSLAETALNIIGNKSHAVQQSTTLKTLSHSTDACKSADFEEAIAATGYGYFNIALMMVALPCCVSSVYESASTSFVIPSAECDLQLSLMAKGVLNAIAYAGMITSAIPWGYVSDILGRRKLIVYGLFLDSMCMLASSMSQNVWMLMLFKYLGGLIMCGPFAVLMSYLSEFHGIKYRENVMMIVGGCFSLATISLPVIAWSVIPNQMSLYIGQYFTMHSWQVFLMICAIPSFLGATGVVFLPESPKFLMSRGRNEEALAVMQTIFHVNTGKPRAEYPIKSLVNELSKNIEHEKVSPDDPEAQYKLSSLSTGLTQMLPLLRKPLLGKCCLTLAIYFTSLGGLNTMRLWLPQLYTMVSNFDMIDENSPYEHNICGVIAYSINQTVTNMHSIELDGSCEPTILKDSMYMNTIYSGISGLVGYIFAAAIISYFGAKNTIICGMGIIGACGIALAWATNMVSTVILSSIYVSLGSICTTAFIGVVVNMFPTSLRTMTISVAMMSGRLGALLGNVVFPYLLAQGCLPPFLLEGFLMLFCGVLCLALPQTSKSALQ